MLGAEVHMYIGFQFIWKRKRNFIGLFFWNVLTHFTNGRPVVGICGAHNPVLVIRGICCFGFWYFGFCYFFSLTLAILAIKNLLLLRFLSRSLFFFTAGDLSFCDGLVVVDADSKRELLRAVGLPCCASRVLLSRCMRSCMATRASCGVASPRGISTFNIRKDHVQMAYRTAEN